MSLADSTELIAQTTDQLMGESGSLTPQAGVTLIDQWLEPLQTAQNTKPLADTLVQLKKLLQANPVNDDAVRIHMGELAENLSLIGTDMGGEGEMPGLLEGLSAALREAAKTSKDDQT